jgi:hypothetical protein
LAVSLTYGSEVGGRDLLFIHGNNYLPLWLLVKERGEGNSLGLAIVQEAITAIFVASLKICLCTDRICN